MDTNAINPAESIELMQGVTTEEMKSMYFDSNALREPKYKVWQLNSKGHRYYYRFADNGEPIFYPSVTTILSQTMPTSPFLIKWMADLGIDEAERYKNERAHYGTFMHAQFEKLIIAGTYDLDAIYEYLQAYIEQEQLAPDFIHYAEELKKDILAFAQFVQDYDVKPLAVEIALVHPLYNYAGMIDLPCTMKVSPKKEERVNAIIDFKSGKKGFHEDYEVQLGMYRELWNVNFEDVQIERIYNFAPKDWRKKPTYNLKDQTDSPNLAKIPHLLAIAGVEDRKLDNTFTTISGTIDLSKKTDFSANIESKTLAELVKPKQDTPKE